MIICDYGCNNQANHFFKNVKRWCCSNHSNKCPGVKKRISTSIKFIYEDENSTYNKKKEEIKSKRRKSLKKAWKNKESKWHSKETKDLQRNINLRNREKGIYDSKEYRLKLSRTHKKIWANPNSSYNSPERGKKISSRMYELFQDPIYLKNYQEGCKTSPNKSELILIDIINSLDLDYIFTGNFTFWIGGRNPDFINKSERKLIELFGDYWHSIERTKMTKEEHEKERLHHFSFYGFDTLIIWESELINKEQIKMKIVNFDRKG